MLLGKRKKRILVVDDDEDFLSVVRTVLEFAGFRVDTAPNGEIALKEIKKHKYSLLIIDVYMPKIDGVKLFQMVRKSKKYKDVPVLFVSGQSAMVKLEERKREIVEKAEAYIEKPFKTKALMEKVRDLTLDNN